MRMETTSLLNVCVTLDSESCVLSADIFSFFAAEINTTSLVITAFVSIMKLFPNAFSQILLRVI